MKNQTRIKELIDLIENHDCHISEPADECICDELVDELVRVKNEDDPTTRYLEHIRQGIVQF